MRRFALVFITCLLLLAGCEEESTVPEEPTQNFNDGTGLIAQFEPFGVIQDNIQTIYETDAFPLEVRIKNQGNYQIKPGDVTIKIRGINFGDFSNIVGAELKNSNVLEGISEFNTEGDEEVVDFTPEADAMYMQRIAGAYKPHLFAGVDYYYETEVIVSDVCLNGDVTDVSICDPRGTPSIESSGAPVRAANVDQDTAGKGVIVFSFDIEKGECEKVTTRANGEFGIQEMIRFELLNDQEMWTCKSAGKESEARLVDGKARINCKLNQVLEDDEVYTRQLAFTLSYLCKTSVNQELRIIEVEE